MSSLHAIQCNRSTGPHSWRGEEENALQAVRHEINPKEIAINFVYLSMSSLHAIQRTGRYVPASRQPVMMGEACV